MVQKLLSIFFLKRNDAQLLSTLAFYEIIHQTTNTRFQGIIQTFKTDFLETHSMWIIYLDSQNFSYETIGIPLEF